VLSKVTLGASYSWSQYGGALVVCFGIFIVLAPQVLGGGVIVLGALCGCSSLKLY
jgi:hypothetical protein